MYILSVYNYVVLERYSVKEITCLPSEFDDLPVP